MKNGLPAENGGIADNGSQLGHGINFTAHSLTPVTSLFKNSAHRLTYKSARSKRYMARLRHDGAFHQLNQRLGICAAALVP